MSAASGASVGRRRISWMVYGAAAFQALQQFEAESLP
jgi:hypothetical protein